MACDAHVAILAYTIPLNTYSVAVLILTAWLRLRAKALDVTRTSDTVASQGIVQCHREPVLNTF